MEVPADFNGLIEIPFQDEWLIQLKENGGSRVLNMTIDTTYASYIPVIFGEVKMPRPIMPQLIVNILATIGADIQKVVVTDLAEGTFHSNIHIGLGAKTHAIDAHVTDALMIALAQNCPIFIEEEVFKKSADNIARLRRTEAEISDAEMADMIRKINSDMLPQN